MAAVAVICFLLAVRFVTKNGVAYTESFFSPTFGDGNDGHSSGQSSSNKGSENKDPCVASNPNHAVCQLLSELAEYEKQVAGNMEKHDLYMNAISILNKFGEPIKSGKEARNYLGISYQISNIIDEFLETGGLAKMSSNPNYDLCHYLYELGNNEIKASGNIHKYNAYRKAARSLSKHNTRIKSGDEAQTLEGIGDSIGRRIDEFLNSERLRKNLSNPNYDLCEYLCELGDKDRKMTGNLKMYSVYRNVARTLAKFIKPIESGQQVKRLRGIDDIMITKIDEFFEIEKLRQLPSNPNYNLCEYFTALSHSEGKVTGNVNKYNAYKKAARVLSTLGSKILSGDQARKLEGFDDSMIKKIDKFLEIEKKKRQSIKPNNKIYRFLTELGEHERRVSGNLNTYDYYQKAAKKLIAIDIPIRSGAQAKILGEVDENISEKIDEYIENERIKDELTNPNHDICEFLTELADYEINVNNDTKKQELYQEAVVLLTKYGVRIKTSEQAQAIQGIDFKIAVIIGEFIENGLLDIIAPNPNYDLCQLLNELGKNELKSSGNVFNYIVYRKAARTLANYGSRLQSGTEAKKIKGIDDGIMARIEEFLETEKLRKFPSNPNYDLCEYLSELGNYERKYSGSTKMYNVYRKASRVLATLGTPIQSGKEAGKLKGIDENISTLIDKFIATEKLKRLPSNPNHDICEYLFELGNHERNVIGNLHMYKVYRTAVEALTSYGKRIKSGEEAQQLKGISIKVAEQIGDFLNTEKKTTTASTYNARNFPASMGTAIKELTKVSGIGITRAKQLYKQGITSIDLLRQNQNTTKLNKLQQLGIKYFYDFEKKMPRSNVYEIEKFIKITMNKFDLDYNISFCGDYRLGKEFIEEIVILVTHSKILSNDDNKNNKLRLFVDILKKNNIIIDTVRLGEKKFSGVCKINDIPRLLNIRFCPYDHYYCCMLYLTGNRVFYKHMKEQALSKNLELTEYTLRPSYSQGLYGTPVVLTSEEEIFEYLRCPYKKPEERNEVKTINNNVI